MGTVFWPDPTLRVASLRRQSLEQHERVIADFPENGADRRAHEDVAQEVHTENDPGSGNEHCNGEEGSQKLGIEETN